MGIVEFIKGQDPVMLALVGMGLFLIAPVLYRQVVSMVGFVKDKVPKVVPVDEDSAPAIEVIVKEWADLYKICHKAKLYDACDKLDEAWGLLRKVEKDGE